jgi:hydroxymethylpyrimidine/phosphomethylpyrimidine kinase
MSRLPTALSIAGSDSGGGAGVQADLKTFAAFGVYGTSAIVAVTAQNSREVVAIHPVPPEAVAAQIRAVVEDFGVDAAKTGMLWSREIVRTVSELAKSLRIPNLVVDPVMSSKDGTVLLGPEAVEALRQDLLPLARVVTPNLAEAEALVGRKLADPGELRQAARELREMGPRLVVIKGGHLPGPPADLLYDGASFTEFTGERVGTRSDHGTGCTFSAAITALLARGQEPATAVSEAKAYVAGALAASPPLGGGRGPLDHFYRFRKGGGG